MEALMTQTVQTGWTRTNGQIAADITAVTGCPVSRLSRTSGLSCEADLLTPQGQLTVFIADRQPVGRWRVTADARVR